MIQLIKILVILLFLPLLLDGCNQTNKKNANNSLIFEFDSISLTLKYAETLFVIPSPEQTSILLKKCQLGFHPEILAPGSNPEKYNTTFKKSIILGIWGANISYLNLYQQKEAANKYLQNIKTALIDLEIYQSIDKKLIDNLMKDFGNNDSVTYYLAELYRTSNHILKSNEHWDLSALLIAGGWLESFYYLTSLYTQTKNEQLFEVILYQGEILNNLLKILSPFYEKSIEYSEFIDGLINISYEFDVIDKISKTNHIQTDTIRHITNIDNTAHFILSGSKMGNLFQIVSDFRNKILD